jgi:putative ABC transport system permease protein
MTPVLKSRDTFDSTLRSARSTVSFRETINLAFDSFRASKTRFLLTMLGMVIGSASIVLVATLGLTGRRFAIDKISSIGPNMIELQYVGGSVAGPDNVQVRDEMTLEDMTTILDEVPGLAYSSPMLEIQGHDAAGGESAI